MSWTDHYPTPNDNRAAVDTPLGFTATAEVPQGGRALTEARLYVNDDGLIVCTRHGDEAIYVERPISGLTGFWRCGAAWCPAPHRSFYAHKPTCAECGADTIPPYTDAAGRTFSGHYCEACGWTTHAREVRP